VIHTDAAPLIPFLGELCSAKLWTGMITRVLTARALHHTAHCPSKHFRFWNEPNGGSPWLFPQWRREHARM
jgi:hypothetical protein